MSDKSKDPHTKYPKDKTCATLVGLAIGDALGMPFEMKSAISPMLTEWDGLFKAGGTFWYGEAGQYTDDTLMSIALAKSIIQSNGYDPEDVAKEYLAWYETKNTRGIGATTANAMVNLKLGAHWTESGLTGEAIGGNGTAMRAAPIGLVYRNNSHALFEFAFKDASITHNSLEPKIGSVAVAFGIACLARGLEKEILVASVADALVESVVAEKLDLALQLIIDKVDHREALAQLHSIGYVPTTVATAFYCVEATDSFKDALLMCIRAGGDTDTTAAICGALAGTLYGLEGIPQEYKDQLENFELLCELDDELINMET